MISSVFLPALKLFDHVLVMFAVYFSMVVVVGRADLRSWCDAVMGELLLEPLQHLQAPASKVDVFPTLRKMKELTSPSTFCKRNRSSKLELLVVGATLALLTRHIVTPHYKWQGQRMCYPKVLSQGTFRVQTPATSCGPKPTDPGVQS